MVRFLELQYLLIKHSLVEISLLLMFQDLPTCYVRETELLRKSQLGLDRSLLALHLLSDCVSTYPLISFAAVIRVVTQLFFPIVGTGVA